jgi:hypothetical protein
VTSLTGAQKTIAESWAAFDQAMRLLPSQTGYSLVLKLALDLLGYWTLLLPELFEQDRESIQVFQTMMGLEADGVPGPITRQALLDRLVDRGLLPS